MKEATAKKRANSVMIVLIVNEELVFRFPSLSREVKIAPELLDEAMKKKALFHGVKQKVGDAAAKERDPETGKPASVEEKYAAVAAMASRLEAGEWTSKQSGGGLGLLAQALAEVRGKSFEEALAYLQGLEKDKVKKIKALPQVKEVMERLKPEMEVSAEEAEGLLEDF